MKLYRILILSIITTFISCNDQNEKNDSKIIELNENYGFFYELEEVDINELDKRVEVTGDKNYEELKKLVSKEALDAKAINFFNKNFSSSEIEAFYNESKRIDSIDQSHILDSSIPEKIESSLSPELKKKVDSLFKKLGEEGNIIFQDFKHQVHVLDSINYNTLKNDTSREVNKKYEIHTANGIYETISFDYNYQDNNAFMNSIKVVDQPGVSFNNILEIYIEPSFGSSLYYIINVVFNEEGTQQLRKITAANVDKPLPIIVDNKIIMAPFVYSVIDEGRLHISGGQMDYVSAREIVDNIRK